MKTNSWIWILAVLLMVTFLFLCAGISLAADDDIKCTSVLTADETWIPPEGQVDFVVELSNTGDVDIERFEIITPDSILAGEYGELAAGESVSVDVPIIFNKEGEYPVELFVVGYSGEKSLTTHTNSLTITVSSSPEPIEEIVPQEELAEDLAQEQIEQTDEAQLEEPTVQPSPQFTPEEAAKSSSQTNPDENERKALYIIIGGLGVLLLIIVIIIFNILNKKRRQN